MRNNNLSIISKIKAAFAFILVASLVAQFFVEPHNHFPVENIFFFNAGFGFLACVVIVLFSKLIGAIVKQPEDYYKGSKNND